MTSAHTARLVVHAHASAVFECCGIVGPDQLVGSLRRLAAICG